MKRALLCGASAMTAVVTTLALSSTANAAAAAAAATDQSQTTLGELIVVAEKRSQNIETVPVAVSAYGAQQRDLLGIATVQDLTDFTPGLAYTTFSNRPYMRGIGRQSDNLAVESGVAIYVDGVYNGANASTILQTDTLFTDQIEVLRGPQSTLYGRNADGGAINYISRRPTKDFQGEMRAGAANYNKYFVEGSVSGPINDSWRFLLGGNYTSQTGKGYYTNIDGPPEGGSVAQGGNGTSYHVEGQLEGSIGDKVDFWAKAATSDYSVSFHTQQLFGLQDTRENSSVLFPNQNYGLCALPGGMANPGCAEGIDPIVSVTTLAHTTAANPTATNPRFFDADFRSNSNQAADVILASSLTYHADGFDVKYLFGYQKFSYTLLAPWTNSEGVSSGVESFTLQGPSTMTALCQATFNNAGCTQNLVVNPAHTNFTFDEFEHFYSNEINFSSTGNGPVQWIGGLYWYHEHYDQPINVNDPSQAQVGNPVSLDAYLFPILGIIPGPPSIVPVAANPTHSVYNEDTQLNENSYAAFGQVDWQVNPSWKFTGGLRYSYDKKSGFEAFRVILFNFNGGVGGVGELGANTPAFDATACTGPFKGTGACTIDAATGKAVRTLSASWDALTGTAGVAWTPDSDTLGYLRYSRGYKTGGFNSGTVTVNPETDKETVDAAEIGLKKTIGHTLIVNGAAFYYWYRNDQQPVGVLDQTSNLINTQIFNLPMVHSYGFELETTWRPVDNLTFNLNYSYLVSKIASSVCLEDTTDPLAQAPDHNATAGCPQPSPTTAVLQQINGQTLPEAPRNKVSLNALYQIHLNPGTLSLDGTYIWKSSEYDSPFNRTYTRAPSYAQVNLRATFTDTANRYSVVLFMDNVFNRLGYDGTFGLPVTTATPATPGLISKLVSFTAPRTYGIEFQYRFK